MGCNTCDGTYTVCLTCKPLYYLRTDNLCYISCPDLFFANNATNTCDPCHSSCGTCTIGSQCLTCRTGDFLRPLSDTLCYPTCLPGTF